MVGDQTFGKYSEKEQTGMVRVVFLQWKELHPDKIKNLTPTIAQRILFNMFRDKYRNNQTRKPSSAKQTKPKKSTKPLPSTDTSTNPVEASDVVLEKQPRSRAPPKSKAKEKGSGTRKRKSNSVVESDKEDFVFDPASIGQSADQVAVSSTSGTSSHALFLRVRAPGMVLTCCVHRQGG